MAHCLPTSLSSGPCVTVVLLLNLLVEDVAGGISENHINVVVPSGHNLHQSHHICRIAVERPEILGCFPCPPQLSHGSTPWRCQAARRSVRHSQPMAKPEIFIRFNCEVDKMPGKGTSGLNLCTTTHQNGKA